MSQATARAVRRDIRRAVGADGLEAINQQTACLNNQVLPNLNALTARITNVDDRLRALEEGFYDVARDEVVSVRTLNREHAALRTQLIALERALWSLTVDVDTRRLVTDQEFSVLGRARMEDSLRLDRAFDLYNFSFWQRLRWLVTGR